jgi:C1A family cysteine protease
MELQNRLFNLKKDIPDDRDYPFKATKLVDFQYEVDLRPYDTEVRDQGSLGSCMPHAVTSLQNFVDKKDDTPYYFYLSCLYLYYHARAMRGWENEDSGSFIRDGMKIMAERGCATESYFPYDIRTFRNKPSDEAEENAPLHKIGTYYRCFNIQDIMQSIAEGYPVVAGIDLYSSFESWVNGVVGVVPLPKDGETYLGGHAVMFLGYKRIDGKLYIIAKNSWGVNWGDRGYFYLPEEYFTPYYMSDMWTAR